MRISELKDVKKNRGVVIEEAVRPRSNVRLLGIKRNDPSYQPAMDELESLRKHDPATYNKAMNLD